MNPQQIAWVSALGILITSLLGKDKKMITQPQQEPSTNILQSVGQGYAGFLSAFRTVLQPLFTMVDGLYQKLSFRETNFVSARTTTGAGILYADVDTITFPFQSRTIDIHLFDFGVIVQYNIDGATYQYEWELSAPGFYSYDLTAKTFRIRAKTVANQARYQIVAWR